MKDLRMRPLLQQVRQIKQGKKYDGLLFGLYSNSGIYPKEYLGVSGFGFLYGRQILCSQMELASWFPRPVMTAR